MATATVSPQVQNLIDESVVVIAHTDIAASDVDWRRESGETEVMDRRHIPTLRKGGVTVVCDHVGGDWRYGYLPATRLHTDSLQRLMRVLDHTYTEIAASRNLMLVRTVDDIHRAKQEGKIGFIFCLEGASPLQNEISYLRNFYRLGLRCLGLTHDVRNEVADGVREREGGGLTHFGVTVVEECNRLGIVVDVSHCSDKGTEDALEVSKDPIIASHSNARSLCGHRRNLTDELIKGIAETGGVIGFHALERLLSDRGSASFKHVLDHIEYIAKIGGIDAVGIGPDIMENWDPNIVNYVSERARTVNGVPFQTWKHSYAKGMSTNADLPSLIAGLLDRGFSEDDMRKFMGGNFMRVFKQVWKPENSCCRIP